MLDAPVAVRPQFVTGGDRILIRIMTYKRNPYISYYGMAVSYPVQAKPVIGFIHDECRKALFAHDTPVITQPPFNRQGEYSRIPSGLKV